MTARIVHLNRWVALANLAMEAAAGGPDQARALGEAAGRMVTATPPATEKYAMAVCNAFRWLCQGFAFATPSQRQMLTPALRAEAEAVRRLFDHVGPPTDAVSMAKPVERPRTLFDGGEPAWTQRKDIAG